MSVIQLNEAPRHNNGRLKSYYVEQNSVAPPIFSIVVNNPIFAHFSNIRFIENKIRSIFHFENISLIIKLKNCDSKKLVHLNKIIKSWYNYSNA